VKAIEFGTAEGVSLRVKPNLPVLGPRLGRELAAVKEALETGEWEPLEGGGFRAAGHELGPDDVLVERTGQEGFAVASENGVTVSLDTSLDEDLNLEGSALDVIHKVNTMRRDAGFELTDRIALKIPETLGLERHFDWIKAETLAEQIETTPELEIEITKLER